jgi:CTP synthase
MEQFKTRFVVIAGGVISGVGKGVVTASIGKILKEHGYKTTLIKIDPYINYDAGTLRPTEHGEVWVTHDGGEIDQDLGTYERFIEEDISKKNAITTGQIYKTVIDKERRGEYLGQTVQFMPHIIEEILHRVKAAAQGYEIAVIEIGGTIGDYENQPFLFAFKSLARELGAHRVACGLVTYLPVPEHIGEMKTKPTQQAVRMLGEQGILPDFIVCRSKEPLDEIRKKKIEVVANISADRIITAPDLTTVYEAPLAFEKQDLGNILLRHFQLTSRKTPDWSSWQKRVNYIKHPERTLRIAVVGKYVESGSYSLTDSYLSICQALIHAGVDRGVHIEIDWISAKLFEQFDEAHIAARLAGVAGLIVPGGFGTEGVEGKINAIKYVRTHNIPYLGLCYGMQLAAIEYARNVCKLAGAQTVEVNPDTPHPIIVMLPVQQAFLENHEYGGTMRLGSYDAYVVPGSKVHALYKDRLSENGMLSERHRHRYEMNPLYRPILEQAGFLFSAYHERFDGTHLMEFAEIPGHPFFIATQSHPEFTSRFTHANPLFAGFIHAGLEREKEVTVAGFNTVVHQAPKLIL